jgi:hypothetical protein
MDRRWNMALARGAGPHRARARACASAAVWRSGARTIASSPVLVNPKRRDIGELPRKESMMTAHVSPILALIFGILILIVPRFLNYFVAIYLIVTGLLGLGVFR